MCLVRCGDYLEIVFLSSCFGMCCLAHVSGSVDSVQRNHTLRSSLHFVYSCKFIYIEYRTDTLSCIETTLCLVVTVPQSLNNWATYPVLPLVDFCPIKDV